nr:MAG TPA: hypothetical protein [Caudoviricetes sp.]
MDFAYGMGLFVRRKSLRNRYSICILAWRIGKITT